MNDNTIYGIEESEPDYYGCHKYRWYSKYNGARGPWCYKKVNAVKGGEDHENIIKTFHGKTGKE